MKTRVLRGMLVAGFMMLLSCGTQKPISAVELANLQEMVDQQTFRVDARWANPLNTTSFNAIANAGLLPIGSNPGRIDITGSGGYLEVRKDSVFAELPFFGERHFGSNYNAQDAGIQFKGLSEDLELTFDEKKQFYKFQFDINNEFGEQFTVNGTLFPKGKAQFYINSSDRNTIGYEGRSTFGE